MECKNCGAEAPEGASYCGVCGARLDGKRACKACGRLNEETHVYCVYCGARMDGKKVCSACGTAYEGRFCPTCGLGATAEKAKAEKKRETSKGAWGVAQKILDIVGGGAAMLGVLLALVFVFFIGVSIAGEKDGIFYYFGRCYKDIDGLIAEMGFSEAFEGNILQTLERNMRADLIVFNVFGTLISVCTLLSVIAFATVAIVVYVRHWLGYTERRAEKWAFASVLSFMLGSALFLALHKTSLSVGAETVATKLTGATVTGIVLSAVFIGICCICKLVAKGKELLGARCLTKCILSLAGLIFVSVAFVLAENAGLIFRYTVGKETTNIKTGFLVSNVEYRAVCGAIAGALASTQKVYDRAIDAMDAMMAFNIVAQLMAIGLIVFSAISVCKYLGNFAEEKTASGIVYASLAVVCAIGLLVFDVLAWERFDAFISIFAEDLARSDISISPMALSSGGSAYSYGTKYTGVICALVFASLNLAVSVALCIYKAIGKRREENAETEACVFAE